MLTFASLPQRICTAFTDANVLGQAFLFQLLHFSNTILDRRIWVDTVEIVQIRLATEKLDGLLDTFADVGWRIRDGQIGRSLLDLYVRSYD